jgi:serine/threonine-protein kinase
MSSSDLIAGRYRIISQLGEGGMGVVYRAWDNEHDVPVVVKMPKADKLSDQDFIERFNREIKAMAGLAHPHIVPIVGNGQDEDGRPYVAMRFLPGGSLSDRRRRGPDKKPLPTHPSLLHHWLPAIAEALDFVHRSGVIHRDVKPDNIFFDARWNAFLGDFGIAKVVETGGAVEKDMTMTATGMAVGTHAYMSPEVFSNRPVAASDQYSLAITVYELLAGTRPFTGESSHIIAEHLTMPVPPLKDKQPQLPARLCEAVHRALSKKPEDRFETCGEFAAALLKVVPVPSVKDGVTRVMCPACHAMLDLDEKVAGKSGKCRNCSAPVTVSTDLEAVWLHSENLAQPTRTNGEADPAVAPFCSMAGPEPLTSDGDTGRSRTRAIGPAGLKTEAEQDKNVCEARALLGNRKYREALAVLSGVDASNETPEVQRLRDQAREMCDRVSHLASQIYEAKQSRIYQGLGEILSEYSAKAEMSEEAEALLHELKLRTSELMGLLALRQADDYRRRMEVLIGRTFCCGFGLWAAVSLGLEGSVFRYMFMWSLAFLWTAGKSLPYQVLMFCACFIGVSYVGDAGSRNISWLGFVVPWVIGIMGRGQVVVDDFSFRDRLADEVDKAVDTVSSAIDALTIFSECSATEQQFDLSAQAAAEVDERVQQLVKEFDCASDAREWLFVGGFVIIIIMFVSGVWFLATWGIVILVVAVIASVLWIVAVRDDKLIRRACVRFREVFPPGTNAHTVAMRSLENMNSDERALKLRETLARTMPTPSADADLSE